ncbi:MAG: hypothetical protein LBH80_07045 [Prevotellaceae bacterium]|nr:hypothetical protein [Prevotellaceae bacterium]
MLFWRIMNDRNDRNNMQTENEKNKKNKKNEDVERKGVIGGKNGGKKKTETTVEKTMLEKSKRTKTGGRKAGTPNKTTAELKGMLAGFISDKLQKFLDNFEDLAIEDQLAIIKMFLPYVIPKQSESKITLDDKLTQAVKESMSKINTLFS